MLTPAIGSASTAGQRFPFVDIIALSGRGATLRNTLSNPFPDRQYLMPINSTPILLMQRLGARIVVVSVRMVSNVLSAFVPDIDGVLGVGWDLELTLHDQIGR